MRSSERSDYEFNFEKSVLRARLPDFIDNLSLFFLFSEKTQAGSDV